MARWDIPVLITIDPHVELTFGQDVDHGLYRLAGNQVFAYDRKIGIEKQTSIKRRDWILKLKIVDQHLHAPWGPTTGDGKSNSRFNDFPNGGTCPRRYDFIGSNQCTVHIRHDQTYIF